MNSSISIFSFNTLYKILKPFITCILWNSSNHNHNNNDGKSQNWCNNTWKIGISKHQETDNIFSQNSVQLVHCMTDDNKMNKCIFFFYGITFKIRSKLPLLWLLDHTQLWYTHEWLASSAQVTSLLQRLLISQHKTNITDQHSCPQQDLNMQFQNWEAADLCLRQHSHQGWHKYVLVVNNWFQQFN